MYIDTHNHFVPQGALRRLEGLGLLEWPVGGPALSVPGRQPMALVPDLWDEGMLKAHMQEVGFTHVSLMVPPFVTLYDLPGDLSLQYSQAYNDGVAEMQARDKSYFGLATLPLHDPEASAREVRRAVGDLGLKGVGIITHTKELEFSSPAMEPLYRAIDDLGVPIYVHPDVTNTVGGTRTSPYYLRNLVGNPSETALAMSHLLFSGVLDRYPNLTFVLSHGGGTFPWIIGRLDHGYEVRSESKIPRAHPSAYLRRFYYDTVVFNPTVLRSLVELVGSDRVVAGTDWPFDMGDVDPKATIEASFLSAADVENIMWKNAARLIKS
jgi:aminocarboxymuconate-semialdehyde decarboxylase